MQIPLASDVSDIENADFDMIRERVGESRDRINELRQHLSQFFVGKQEMIDVMLVAAAAQEPLLFIGEPGTAKSDLVIKFCEALQFSSHEYFEYMLTKFTEPSEILGPIDINLLREGRYIRKIEGKLPVARVVFLDEIFKSNSAVLNVLLTILNERKFYQEGKPVPVRMRLFFAATNTVPDFEELAALKDRFTLKVQSRPVREQFFEDLIERGLRNESYRIFGRRPWEGVATFEDFQMIKRYLDYILSRGVALAREESFEEERRRTFPDELFILFRRIIRTLEKEDKIQITDRKVIKLYKLIRTRAFLFHGGTVRREDLSILRYTAEKPQEFTSIRKKVDDLLGLSAFSTE